LPYTTQGATLARGAGSEAALATYDVADGAYGAWAFSAGAAGMKLFRNGSNVASSAGAALVANTSFEIGVNETGSGLMNLGFLSVFTGQTNTAQWSAAYAALREELGDGLSLP